MSSSWNTALAATDCDVPSFFQIHWGYPLIHAKTTRTMRGELTWIKMKHEKKLKRLTGAPEEPHHLDSNPNNFYLIYAPVELLTYSEIMVSFLISLESRLFKIKSFNVLTLQWIFALYLDSFFIFAFSVKERYWFHFPNFPLTYILHPDLFHYHLRKHSIVSTCLAFWVLIIY